VKTHLERIYAKLGVGDRTAAALMAIERGLVSIR
jgi:DNA-binding NarL/FixJ family response regulator